MTPRGSRELGPPLPTTTTAIGASAEEIATRVLIEAGYHVVERNFRCKLGELDLVARDGGVLCFVEVRSRGGDGHGLAAETVTRAKQRKVTRAAYAYLAQRRPRFDEARFDVVSITGERIDLIRDAWRLEPRV
jgi:putative endonuclease